MNRLAERFRIFMLGRYGTDQLSIGLLILYIIAIFIFRSGVLAVIPMLILIFYMYRTFSRNTIKRSKENQMFLKFWNPIARTFSMLKKQITDRDNRYYRCSGCHQQIRVPKGKGKICITCPKCRNEFIKKT